MEGGGPALAEASATVQATARQAGVAGWERDEDGG
jgi:hypothetical protein